ncbi:MAG: sigma 54-interacting transcriptional regulator [Phycisphaerales bacterium]|nr:sigma 54-interacting transcriptional regulator [Phycisphaerales bacterium]
MCSENANLHSGGDDRGLLRAVQEVAGELELDRLAHRLVPWLIGHDRVEAAGVAVVDPELDLLTVWRFTADDPNAPAEPVQYQHGPQVLAYYASAQRLARGGNSGGALDDMLLGRSSRWGLSSPIMLHDRWLGFVFAAISDAGDDDGLHEYISRLASLIAPVVWNCHTHARFKHGDLRRDTLITLSDAINRSLKLETVLDSTRQAMRGLADHVFSAIMLVDAERSEYLMYPNVGDTQELSPPERHLLEGSLLAEVLKRERTYESDDLDGRRTFAVEGRCHLMGSRRCVAAPMFVRGRIIGCLFVGVRSATPVLRVDVWLYENIALQLALAIDNARQLEQVRRLSEELAQQNRYLREEIQSEHDFGEMIGESAAMQAVRDAIARVGPTDSTVLITGETGVGKELVARAIHAASTRADQPMVKVNCAAIPEGMVESELFGHERGAFTSAVERRIGRFELANGGTLFLDEVGELSHSVQAKLLRVLQDGAFERVGGTKTISTDARIIAATNRDLAQSVKDGAFRSDLYYRFNVFPLHVAPLRERSADIPLLIQFFVEQYNRRMGKQVESVEPETMADLCARHWPGNIRELRHEIERAMILSDQPVLRVTTTEVRPSAGPRPVPSTASLADAQAEHIRWALTKTAGIIEGEQGAARLLGLKPSTLRFRMKRLGIHRPA